MDCRAVMAVMVDKRMKDAAKVREAPTKNGLPKIEGGRVKPLEL